MTYPHPWLAFAVVGCLLAGVPAAGAGEDKQEARPEAFEEAVEQLGSPDPKLRDEATRLLWDAGRWAEPALRRAATGESGAEPEVAARARALLDRVESGVRPDTPQQATDLAVRYKTNPNPIARVGAAQGLIAMGDPAAPVLLRLWSRESDAAVKARVLEAMQASCPRYARLLLLEGDDGTAGQLLQSAAEAQGGQAAIDYAAYLAARGRLKTTIAEWTRKGALENRLGRRRVLGWVCLADGDVDGATAIARDSGAGGDDNLLRAAQFAAGDWKALAAYHSGALGQAVEPINAMNLSAALFHLAGDSSHAEGELKRLRKFIDEKPQYAFICAETFFVVGRANEAVHLLRAHDPATAIYFLASQLRFDEAFALADRAAAAGGAKSAWVHVGVARVYAALGERDKAQAALTAAVAAAAAQGPPALAQVNAAAVEIEANSAQREKAVERALAAADETARAALVAKLFPPRRGDGRFWWRTLRTRPEFVNEPPRATFDRLDALLGNKAPAEQARAWCAAAADAALAEGDAYSRKQGVLAVVDLLRAYGLDQPAEDVLDRASRGGPGAADALLRLGDLRAGSRRFDDAAACYERARVLAPPGQPEAALAAYLQGRALKQAGREEAARPLLELARALPLGNDGARNALCAALEERGLKEEAAAEGVLLMRLHGVWSLGAADAARRAAVEAAGRRDFAAAADMLGRSMLGVVRQEATFSRQEGYLAGPRAVETYRALAKLASAEAGAGDKAGGPDRAAADEGAGPGERADAARAESPAEALRRLVTVLPSDTDWTIRCVSELDGHGRRDVGDLLFADNARLLQAVCDRYPAAAQYHNSLAWLAARCGRDLDGALKHARRAVELQPDNPAFLDTLAETHFRRGDKAAAVDCMKQCLQLDPAFAYYREQLKRFESGTSDK